jgi:hypothetical protein
MVVEQEDSMPARLALRNKNGALLFSVKVKTLTISDKRFNSSF